MNMAANAVQKSRIRLSFPAVSKCSAGLMCQPLMAVEEGTFVYLGKWKELANSEAQLSLCDYDMEG